MKRSKFFMAIGATVLAFGAVAVGRASAKFAAPTKIYYVKGGVCKEAASTLVGNRFTTTSGTNKLVSFQTSGGSYQMYATISGTSCSKPLYANPTNF